MRAHHRNQRAQILIPVPQRVESNVGSGGGGAAAGGHAETHKKCIKYARHALAVSHTHVRPKLHTRARVLGVKVQRMCVPACDHACWYVCAWLTALLILIRACSPASGAGHAFRTRPGGRRPVAARYRCARSAYLPSVRTVART